MDVNKEFKVDEKRIAEIVKTFCRTMGAVVDDVKQVEDKENDIFLRYMAMMRLESLYECIGHGMKLSSKMFLYGFDLHHPVLQTEKAKEYKWSGIDLEKNPFFEMDKSLEAANE